MSFLRHPSKIKTDILKVERLNKSTYIMQILTKRNHYSSYIKIRQRSYYKGERTYKGKGDYFLLLLSLKVKMSISEEEHCVKLRKAFQTKPLEAQQGETPDRSRGA